MEICNKYIKTVINGDLDVSYQTSPIKSNVAIAAAVTSYARIHMMQIKNNKDIVYTDTDSIITTKALDSKFVGKDIGLMKDELEGGIIERGYFLGIKKYGYQYKDINNILHDKSVISGVKRDSISFKEVEDIFIGKSIEKKIDIRFFKSMKDLSMVISPTTTTITMSVDKQLVDNRYKPIKINNAYSKNRIMYKNINFIKRVFNKIKNLSISPLYSLYP